MSFCYCLCTKDNIAAAGSLWIQFSDAKNHLAYRTMPVLISPPPPPFLPSYFYDILSLINVVIIVFCPYRDLFLMLRWNFMEEGKTEHNRKVVF
jgi:hypothetical protein